MSVQWTLVAGFVYAEMVFILLLMLPWIRAGTWTKNFRSRFVRQVEAYRPIFMYTIFGILLLLFFDAIREVRKYSNVDMSAGSQAQMAPNAETHIHLRLFRAQRNLYVSGFALFLWLVIRRMVQMVTLEAQLQASSDASLRQASSASATAKQYLGNDQGKVKKEQTESQEDKEIATLRKQLKSVESDRDAMRDQAQGLKREYDRLMEEFEHLQHIAEGADEVEGKKGD